MRLLPASLAMVIAMALGSQSANAGVMVHMFGWKYNDIANECENVLGPKGYDGVEVSSPAEHVTGNGWWIAYQPVNYKNFTAIGGNETELKSMITRCHKAGIKVYADAVFNQMSDSSGTGSGGSSFGGGTYPAFSAKDFHTACTMSASSYKTSRSEVQTCRFGGLPDLDTGSAYVQGQIATYLKTLTGFGIDGFRIDAAKHISVTDLSAILSQAGSPFVYQEVIYGGKDEVVQPEEYQNLGMVLESRFTGGGLDEKFRSKISGLKNIGESWGFLPSAKAQVMVTNHDYERSGGSLSYKDGAIYRLANVFMLGWPYGYPQVMSGYDFGTATMALAPSVTPCSTGSKWNCEQRWPQIANMVYFHNVTKSVTTVSNWWDNGNNQIAFGRGNKGFVVINNETGAMNQSLTTGLPAGEYCNILAGSALCSGSYVTVDGSGKATFSVAAKDAAAIVAGCTKANNCSGTVDTGRFASMYFRGTPNSWGTTAMTVDSSKRIWSTTVNFTGKGDGSGAQRFKFDVYGNWSENYGDTNADGIAEKGSSKDIYFTGVGKYLVSFKESDLSYTLTQVIDNQAPVAVVSPSVITIKAGESLVLDASGSSDDNGISGYSWSTGGVGKTEALTFDTAGSYPVTVTVTDSAGLSSSATAIITVEKPVTPEPYLSNFKQVTYRGTANSWAAQKMELVADYTWQTSITLTGSLTERFKLDVSEDMTKTYGDRNDDGVVESGSVIYPGYKGTYTLTFNDQSMSYTLVKQGVPYSSQQASFYYSAPASDGSGWSCLPMKLVNNNLWYIRVKWSDVVNQRFRFDIGGKRLRTQVYGDTEKDGIAEQGGLPIYRSGKGYFIIRLNDKTLRYTITAQ